MLTKHSRLAAVAAVVAVTIRAAVVLVELAAVCAFEAAARAWLSPPQSFGL